MNKSVQLNNHSNTHNLHQIWNITFDESILSTEVSVVDNFPTYHCSDTQCPQQWSRCSPGFVCHGECLWGDPNPTIQYCYFTPTLMLKFSTSNHIFYFNITTVSQSEFMDQIHFQSSTKYFMNLPVDNAAMDDPTSQIYGTIVLKPRWSRT